MTKMVTYFVPNKYLFFFTFMGLLWGNRAKEEDTHSEAVAGEKKRQGEREGREKGKGE